MSIKHLLMHGTAIPFCMEGEGGDTGASSGASGDTGGGEGGDGGEGGRATDDGTGGKASMLTGDDESGGDGGDGSTGEDGKIDLNKLLGEELSKNKGFEKYANAENPVQEMAKSLLEAQSKIGKPSVGVPGEDATAEEKSAFNEALGVPKDAAGYGFEKPEGVTDENYNQEHADKWAGILHENNVPLESANALRNAMMEEAVGAEADANKALNVSLDKHLGDEKGVLAKQASELMKLAIPDIELRTQIEAAISNEETPAFAAALGMAIKHMKTTYGLSDENFGDGSKATGKSLDELRADAKSKMQTPAYTDAMHKDHDRVKKEVKDAYNQIGQLTDEAAKQKT